MKRKIVSEFKTFIESVCKEFGHAEAIKPLQDGFDALCESASGNSKRKWISKIYKVAEPLTKGLFRDDNWASVYTLFDTIKKSVPEVEFTVGAKDGGYSNPGDDGMPRRKTYDISGKTPEGFPIVGQPPERWRTRSAHTT